MFTLLRRTAASLILFLCLTAAASSAQAVTSVTVSAQTIDGIWRYGGSTAKLRVYASTTFEQSGSFIIGSSRGSGSWYQEISCTVASTTLSIPSFSILVTTTSTSPGATYTFVFVDSKGTERDVYLSGIKVPDTLGATVTFAQLYRFSTTTAARPTSYDMYSKDQVNALLAGGLTTACINASDSSRGCTKISVPPASSTNPIVVGDNDARANEDYNASSFSNSLSTAVAAMPSSGANLVVSTSMAANGVTIPAYVNLVLTGASQLTGSGTVRIVGDFHAPKNKQVFATGLTVSLAGNAYVDEAHPEWWGGGVGVSASTNVTRTQAAIAALATKGTGDVVFGNGTYDFSGTISLGATTGGGDGLGDFTNIGIKGQGFSYTRLRYTGPTNLPFLKITRGRFNHIRNIYVLNGAGSRATTVGFLETGPARSMQTHGVHYERVTISGFGKGIESGDATVDVQGSASEAMLFEGGSINDCTYGFYANSNYNSLNFSFHQAALQGNDYGIYSVTGYRITVTGCAGGQNGIDFYLDGGGNLITVNGWDAEQSTRLLSLTNGADAVLHGLILRSYQQLPDDHTGIISVDGSKLSIDGLWQGANFITPSVGATGAHLIVLRNNASSLTLKNIHNTDDFPFFLDPGNGGSTGSNYTVESSTAISNTDNSFVSGVAYERGRVVWPGKLSDEMLLQSTSVDMNTATASTLFTCTTGRTCVITKIVVRNASTSLTTASYSHGWNSASYNDVVANASHTELTGGTLITVLTPRVGAKLGASGEAFKVLMNTLQGGAATTTMEVYGYFAS